MKKIIAKAVQGHEYLYSNASAHQVSARSANVICSALNRSLFRLKPNEIWHVYTVSEFDLSYSPASHQKFAIRNNRIIETTC